MDAPIRQAPPGTELTRSCAVRYRHFRYEQARRKSVGVAHIEEHSLGNFAGHFSFGQVYHEERLLPFDFTRVRPFLFYPCQDRPGVIAEVDRQFISLFDFGTSSTETIVPARMSSFSNSSKETMSLRGAGFIFYLSAPYPIRLV